MKIRTAAKIFIAVARYKGFETNRQPYTPQQQHRAVNRLIPLPLRKFVGICNKVKDPQKEKMPWEKIAM